MFMLFHFIVIFSLTFLDSILNLYSLDMLTSYGYMTLIYFAISICPFICIQVRRLHDVGKGGYWWLLGRLFPILQMYVFYLTCKKGDDDTNVYGPPQGGPRRPFYTDEWTKNDFL